MNRKNVRRTKKWNIEWNEERKETERMKKINDRKIFFFKSRLNLEM